MKIEYIKQTFGNGNIITYVKTESGTCYETSIYLKDKGIIERKECSLSLIDTLERARQSKNRIRVWYGDVETGRSWNDECDVMGTVGRSNGNIKIPLLIGNIRSYGGLAILTGSIVRIDDTKTHRNLWANSKFHTDYMWVELINEKYFVLAKETLDSDKEHTLASFSSLKQAYNYIDFLQGKRYSK